MSFLGVLGDQISSQFNLGENTNHTLDNIDLETGKTVKYGSLGDFAQHFDQSAERRYVEEGYLRKDPYNTDPKQFEVLMQEPSATVLVKKKMFSSIGDNYRPDFMDADEKMYYKTMKVLFQNKCAQIAALEKLSKIQKMTSGGSISDQLVPIIISLTDAFNNGLDTGSNLFGALGSSSPLSSGDPSTFTKVVDRLRRIYAFNTTNSVTSWITDSTNLFQSQFGQGTGVIEITNFTNLSTAVSTDINNPGNFSLTISDPYKFMVINEYDIEKAISDATNMFYNSKISQFAKQSSAQLINDLTARLNQTRAARKAGPISIKLAPDTLLGKRVTAILDRLGIELPFSYDSSSASAIFSGGAFGSGATVAPEYLKGGAIAGNDGLDTQKVKFGNITSGSHFGSDSELSLFNRLISTIFSKLSQDANSQNAFQLQNINTNYTRKKLRSFSGRLIIQPMDVVHIYANSKSRYDTKLLSGLQNMFTGLGMLQNLNNTLTGLAGAASALFNPSGDVPLQVEKAAFVGADFPNYLWSMVRGQFVSEASGTHIFAGVVDSAVGSWGSDKYSVDVRGGDNTTYFKQGKINFKPGADVFVGTIFDPLTPFKSNFDTIASTSSFGSTDKTGNLDLLDENLSLLGTTALTKDGLVKHKLGRFAGQPVTWANISQDQDFDPVTGRTNKVFYAPDGLVYKWKEGIGVFTQLGSSSSTNGTSKVGNQNISNEPFAGQDVMNVLSLLITGVPYNFATYFKASQNFDGFGSDPQSQQNGAHSFMSSLRNDLTKTNTLWGNFIPFKNLVIDEASYVQALKKQASVTQKNQVLDRQIKDLQELNNKAMLQGAVSALADKSKYDNGDFLNTKSQADQLSTQIHASIKSIQDEDAAFLRQTGDDTTLESSDFIDSSKLGANSKSTSNAALRRLLRRQLNFLTRRMSYNVRANEDKNLFIVDDFYDKDFDIAAYNKSLTDGLKLYSNDFTSVSQKIAQVAELLNLEVFADTQGHIRIRPPQYNRMPSSVFYKMMYLKDTLKIQVFPQFLDDMFNNKLETLRTRIEILEDQIRLDCVFLNRNTDIDAMALILNQGDTFGTPDSFAFISDNQTGLITEINDLMTAANPDQKNNADNQALRTFDKIEKNTISTKNVFTNSQKYSTIANALSAQKLSSDGTPIFTTESVLDNQRLNDIITRIQTKSGQKINKSDYLITTSNNNVDVQLPTGVTIDIFKVSQELSDKIKERQQAIKLFYSTIKNAQEFKSLDTNSEQTANSLITPGIYGNSNVPEVFEHMIEDETYDDYGIGSGTRYVIKNSQIRNISIQENPPPYTTIEVHGTLPFFKENEGPPDFTSFPGGGNALVTALAIDYDMWRNYGFKEPAVLNVPFLSDPATQCGPYASMLLSRNRKNILRGSVTISGNEFMQPGEVVFIQDNGMLFYVTSVRHSFAQGSSFTTTLELTYGHSPGEYIPTVMDMIGKMIYSNKDVGSTVVYRQDTSASEINMGVLILSPSNKDDGSNIDKSLNIGDSTSSPPNSFSAANSQVINNILYSAATLIASNTTQNKKATLELRTYYNINGDTDTVHLHLLEFADKIRDILVGNDMPGFTSMTVSKQGNLPTSLESKQVKQVESTTVALDDAHDRSSPSQKAIDSARNLVNLNSTPKPPTKGTGPQNNIQVQRDKIRKALFENVVDCWIKIEDIT